MSFTPNLAAFFSSRFRYLPFFGLTMIGFFLTKDNPYFWDTVQFGSKHADWYLSTNFQFFTLPEPIDSGHPPFFGMYIAAIWFIFGKSLAIAHLAILPFTIGSVYLLFKTGDYFLGREKSFFFVILAFVDPTLTAQNILISPDALLIFFMLLVMHGIFYDKRWILMLGAIGLASISMRGMMLVFAFYVFEQTYEFWLNKWSTLNFKTFTNRLLHYIPAGLFGLAFLGYHYYATGWIGHHANSTWAACFEKVGWLGIVKNMGITVFRFSEFGRIGVSVVVAFLLFFNFKTDKKTTQLLWLVIVVLVCIVLPQLQYKILLAPRYLLPISVLLSLFCCKLVFNDNLLKSKNQILIWISVAICLFSGNFWTYPKHISMSWDSTLAHVNYFEPRKEMHEYLKQKKIAPERVGTAFPENSSTYSIDLSEENQSFQPIDFTKNDYIFYSNVMNNFSDEELDELEKSWTNVQSFKKGNVEVILYKRPF